MTGPDGFIAQLEDYLDTFDGETPLPHRVRDAVVAELPRTRQVRSGPGPLKGNTMSSNTSNIARWGLVAGLLVAVGIGSTVVLTGGSGGSGGDQPTPTVAPTSSPSPTPVPLSIQTAPFVPCSESTTAAVCLPPGTYTLGRAVPEAVVDVPAGWFRWDPGLGAVGLLVERPDVSSGSGWGIVVMQVGEVSRDPCDATAGTYAPAEVDTAEELAAAMAAWPAFEATPAVPITISGVDGVQTRLVFTGSTSACPVDMIWRTPDGTPMDSYPATARAGDPADFRIMDLDGKLIAFQTMVSAATSPFERSNGIPDDPTRHEADLVTQQAIMESLRFIDADS